MRATQGTVVQERTILCEVVDSDGAFIEAALPTDLVESEELRGREVSVALEGSARQLPGEVAWINNSEGPNSGQTAVSLDGVRPCHSIVGIRILEEGWTGEAGFASQIGRRASIRLK